MGVYLVVRGVYWNHINLRSVQAFCSLACCASVDVQHSTEQTEEEGSSGRFSALFWELAESPRRVTIIVECIDLVSHS